MENNQTETLPLEDQLKIQMFNLGVQHLNKAEAIEMLADLHTQMILREHLYKKLLKHNWGLDAPLDRMSMQGDEI